MSFREEWQREMWQMQLTNVQKDKIAERVKQADKHPRKDWNFRIVLSSFIVVALLFIVIMLQPHNVTMPDAASQNGVSIEAILNGYFTETLEWFSAVMILMILSIVQLVLVIFQTKRWDRLTFVMNIRLYLYRQKQYGMVHMVAIVLAVLTFGFWFGFPYMWASHMFTTGILGRFTYFGILISSIVSAFIVTSYMLYIHYKIAQEMSVKHIVGRTILYQLMMIVGMTLFMLAVIIPVINDTAIAMLKVWLIVFVAINYCLWSLWMIRDEVRATCPHCGHLFSRREMLKKTFWGYKAKCGQCGGYLYMTRKARKKLDFMSWFFPGTIILLSNLGIPIWFLLVGMVASWLFIMFVITPYTMKFSTENEPLW